MQDKVGHEKTELNTSVASSDGNLTIREKCLRSHVEAIAVFFCVAMCSRAQLYVMFVCNMFSDHWIPLYSPHCAFNNCNLYCFLIKK